MSTRSALGDSPKEKRSNAASARCVASIRNPLSFKEGSSQQVSYNKTGTLIFNSIVSKLSNSKIEAENEAKQYLDRFELEFV